MLTKTLEAVVRAPRSIVYDACCNFASMDRVLRNIKKTEIEKSELGRPGARVSFQRVISGQAVQERVEVIESYAAEKLTLLVRVGDSICTIHWYFEDIQEGTKLTLVLAPPIKRSLFIVSSGGSFKSWPIIEVFKDDLAQIKKVLELRALAAAA